MYGASQQAKSWKNLFKSHGDTRHIHTEKLTRLVILKF